MSARRPQLPFSPVHAHLCREHMCPCDGAGVDPCSALLSLPFAAVAGSQALARTAMHILLSPAMLPRLTTAAVLAVSRADCGTYTACCLWSAMHGLASTDCANAVLVCLEGQKVLLL